MSKYDDLSAKAISVAGRFNRIEHECEFKAAQIIARYRLRLEAPADRLVAMPVDGDLEPTAVGESALSLPPVTQGRDGRWYFGVRVTYGNPKGASWLFETMVLAIRVQAEDFSHFTLGLRDETEHSITSETDLDAFLDSLIVATEDRLDHGFATGKRGIGFTA